MAKRKEKGLIFETSGKAIMFRNWIRKILLIYSIPIEIFIFEKGTSENLPRIWT